MGLNGGVEGVTGGSCFRFRSSSKIGSWISINLGRDCGVVEMGGVAVEIGLGFGVDVEIAFGADGFGILEVTVVGGPPLTIGLDSCVVTIFGVGGGVLAVCGCAKGGVGFCLLGPGASTQGDGAGFTRKSISPSSASSMASKSL